jgi:hypothetical protein
MNRIWSHSGGLSEWQAFIGFVESDCGTSAVGETGPEAGVVRMGSPEPGAAAFDPKTIILFLGRERRDTKSA